MSYVIDVHITQEIIDKKGVDPYHSYNCLCYNALEDMGYSLKWVRMEDFGFTSVTKPEPVRVPIPDEALNYLQPLMQASRDERDITIGERTKWRAIARPFTYQLELPDAIQPVVK